MSETEQDTEQDTEHVTGPEKKERMKELRALLNELSFDLDRYIKEYRELEAGGKETK